MISEKLEQYRVHTYVTEEEEHNKYIRLDVRTHARTHTHISIYIYAYTYMSRR